MLIGGRYLRQLAGICAVVASLGVAASQAHATAITEFSTGLNPGAGPFDTIAGPDGNVWFTDSGTTPAIGRVTPAGAITEFGHADGLNTGSAPDHLTAGADGNVWFTDRGGLTPALGRVTPAGVITEFGHANGLNTGSLPTRIATGPGGNLWFNDLGTAA